MRTKHGKLKGKGEIFRKQLCALSDSGDESEETAESIEKNAKKVKEKHEPKAKEERRRLATESSPKENEKRRNKPNKTSKMLQKTDQNAAIITKNRLTRHIGIYNKSKRSKTILRENLKERLCSKKFQDVQAETDRDMSRVLDCSSFGISSSGGASVKSSLDQDTPECSSLGPTYCSPVSTGQASHRSTAGKEDQSAPENRNLPFETPLQEISENLVQSLNPSDTFRGRNYLAEVQEQLRKLFKQSSVSLQQNRRQNTPTPESSSLSSVQKCLKRKSGENNSSVQHFTNNSTESSLEKRLCPAHYQHGQHIPLTHQETQQNARGNQPASQTLPVVNCHPACSGSSIQQGKSHQRTAARTTREMENVDPISSGSRTVASHDNQEYLPTAPHGSISEVTKDFTTRPSFDILDFLDCVGQHVIVPCDLSKGGVFGTPNLLEVSPPKKPTLDTPSPKRLFYPRKLY